LAIGVLPGFLLVWACATVPPEPTEDQDPNAPEIDAGFHPKRVQGDDEPATTPTAPATTSTTPPPRPTTPVADAAPITPSAPIAAHGDVVISEIMYDPTGPEPASEWFEVHNLAAEPRSLLGIVIQDGAGRTHTIAADVVVQPNGYAVLARDARVTSTVYDYGKGLIDTQGILLANGTTGALSLVGLDTVKYGLFNFTAANGQSAQLQPDNSWKLAAPTPAAPNAPR
jgi:hypothetical protein